MNAQTDNPEEILDFEQEERRIFERFPSRYPAKFKDARNGFGTDVYLRDASAGGVKITTKERLYLNDNITYKNRPDKGCIAQLAKMKLDGGYVSSIYYCSNTGSVHKAVYLSGQIILNRGSQVCEKYF